MEKIIVRYFYSPICPEAFATLNRVLITFTGDYFYVEAFNVAENPLESALPWFPSEEEIVCTCQGKGNKPLLYGLLFINGERIKGFPPAEKYIREVLKGLNIEVNLSPFTHTYSTKNTRVRWNCTREAFVYISYDKDLCQDLCRVCTKYNPYSDIESFSVDNWLREEYSKLEFIKKKQESGEALGVVAYYDGEAVGMIEAFTLELSAKLGFPVSKISTKELMITCLSVAKEVSGYGVANRLVESLVKDARAKGFHSLEVLAFPDEFNWQPISFYTNSPAKKCQ